MCNGATDESVQTPLATTTYVVNSHNDRSFSVNSESPESTVGQEKQEFDNAVVDSRVETQISAAPHPMP